MESGAIRLRAVEPEDLELLYSWENNSDYWVISNTITPFSKFTLRRYIENSHKTIFETGQLRLMIVCSDDKKTIGSIDIFDYDPFHLRAGVGILIGDRDYRKKGYASDSLKCIINYSFGILKLHQLYCNILSDNKDSIKLFEANGFVKCGIKKDWVRTGNSFSDEIMFQLIAS